MAMVCVKGKGECDGCMSCQVPEEIGFCVECGEPIEHGYDYYNIDGELVHEECLEDWAEKFKR